MQGADVSEGTTRYDTVREIRGVSIDEEKEGDFGILCGEGTNVRESNVLHSRRPTPLPCPAPVTRSHRGSRRRRGRGAGRVTPACFRPFGLAMTDLRVRARQTRRYVNRPPPPRHRAASAPSLRTAHPPRIRYGSHGSPAGHYWAAATAAAAAPW